MNKDARGPTSDVQLLEKLFETVGSPDHISSAGGTGLNSGLTVSAHKMAPTALVNPRGLTEPLETNRAIGHPVLDATSAPHQIQDLSQILLPGDGLRVFAFLVLHMMIHTGILDENPGELKLVVLQTVEQGSVPGQVPRVPVNPGILSEQLNTSPRVPFLGVPHSKPGHVVATVVNGCDLQVRLRNSQEDLETVSKAQASCHEERSLSIAILQVPVQTRGSSEFLDVAAEHSSMESSLTPHILNVEMEILNPKQLLHDVLAPHCVTSQEEGSLAVLGPDVDINPGLQQEEIQQMTVASIGSVVKTRPEILSIFSPADIGTIGQQDPGQIQVSSLAGLQEEIPGGDGWRQRHPAWPGNLASALLLR